jgi:hypothetical protein
MPGRSPRSVVAGRGALWPGPLLLALVLAGCSGTPFGESLSRSFSTSPPASPGGAGVSPGVSPSPADAAPRRATPGATAGVATPGAASPGAARPGARPAPSPAAGTTPAAPAGGPTSAAPAAAPRPPANPAPYRVTILLPQADPAAPAEVVTRALRAAGVPFEVETIQRTAPGETPRTATPAPAPAAPAAAPAAPTAPAVRPAPLPR